MLWSGWVWVISQHQLSSPGWSLLRSSLLLTCWRFLQQHLWRSHWTFTRLSSYHSQFTASRLCLTIFSCSPVGAWIHLSNSPHNHASGFWSAAGEAHTCLAALTWIVHLLQLISTCNHIRPPNFEVLDAFTAPWTTLIIISSISLPCSCYSCDLIQLVLWLTKPCHRSLLHSAFVPLFKTPVK